MAVVIGKSRLALCGLLAFCWPLMTASVNFRVNFDSRVLAAHNVERASLGVPPLRWNADLAAGAKQWSDYLARTGEFQHSADGPGNERVGENIWGGTPGAYAPEDMIKRWISEKRHFQAGIFPKTSRTGSVADVSHYTQLVWRSTNQVGCSLSRGAREEILVCRYSGPGNVIGQSVF